MILEVPSDIIGIIMLKRKLFEIDWESLSYHIDDSGNHIVLIDVDLTFVNDGQEDITIKKFFYIEIHFNADWKIYYFKEV